MAAAQVQPGIPVIRLELHGLLEVADGIADAIFAVGNYPKIIAGYVISLGDPVSVLEQGPVIRPIRQLHRRQDHGT